MALDARLDGRKVMPNRCVTCAHVTRKIARERIVPRDIKEQVVARRFALQNPLYEIAHYGWSHFAV
jgi:hypothetical protein